MISYWSCPLTRFGVLSSGGMSVYLYNLSNSLAELGVAVDIYTRSHKENDEKILTIHKNVRVIHLWAVSSNHTVEIKKFGEKMLKFMKGNSLTYDVIHAHYYYSGLVAMSILNALNAPFVQTFHTLGELKEQYTGDSQTRRKNTERVITQKADAIIASTPLEKDDLIGFYQVNKNKLHIISPGVNHRLFRPYNREFSRQKLLLPLQKKIILFVGRIDPIKGLQLLIESISYLSDQYPTFQNRYRVLLIGGDIGSLVFWHHPEVKKIKELIARKKIECCVKFLGSRPHSILPYYYSASDVTVLPSLYESFGLVVLEAMATGACVLASRVGGLGYLVRNGYNGKLFESGDMKDLSKNLWLLLQNPQECQRLSRNALYSSQQYCWSKQAQKILHVYTILSRSRFNRDQI